MSEMRPQLVASGVYVVPFPIGQAYIWDRGDALTLIDTGVPGSAETILAAVRELGRAHDDVTEIVLTHYHADHRGAAADLAEATGAQIVAHRLEAPVIRGEQPQTPPNLVPFEQPIAEGVLAAMTPPGVEAPEPGSLGLDEIARRLVAGIPLPAPVRVDREVEDGATLAGGGQVIHIPGHTAGSIALLAPATAERPAVLFTGDTLASVESAVIAGVFNVDRAELTRSIRTLAGLDFGIACFGHGAPCTNDAARRVRDLAASLG
jgi:glyoxylase-like metal-dependent hydrolase (beta-lactamase superfamily II)